MPPHSVVLSVIGAALLWVGWFGFNAGSALAANALAVNAFLTTHFAAATATLGWVLIEWIKTGKPTVLGAISGAVAGLVVITPAAGFVTPNYALIMGFIGGVVCFFSATALKHALGYDDSLDAFGVHGVGGIIGAFLTGVLAREAISKPGLIDGNAGQVMTQIYGVAITIAYCAVVTLIILYVLKLVMGLRVSEEIEREGLDIRLHGEAVQ